jgi:hypothetical protein
MEMQMAKAPLKQRTVELQDPDGHWTRVVLEAATALASNPIEVKGVEGRRYFVAASPELARLCRRWLKSPLPDTSDAARLGGELPGRMSTAVARLIPGSPDD